MKTTRRHFSKSAGLVALWPWACSQVKPPTEGVLVNDIHSKLNPTTVSRVVEADRVEVVQTTLADARHTGQSISISAGRHAMGAQQFGTDTVLLDTRKLKRVLNFDPERGQVTVEAGIAWPDLINYLVATQRGKSEQWSIAQKQTGADELSLGGALAANAHGRGLQMKPFVSDVESFTLVDHRGELVSCNRQQNPELFGLVAGGYGLYGVVSSLTLRLVPRRKLERVVEIAQSDDLMARFEQRIAEGHLYGDFQFSIDQESDDFLHRGVFSCYRPVDPATPVADEQKQLSKENWAELIYLAHADKAEAFRRYSGYYLSTSGQIYWSDTHQLSTYLDNYHQAVDRRLGSKEPATEMISEIYVPRSELGEFLGEAAEDFRRHSVELIYGTIRLIERDDDSFLAWAKQPYACTIFNLHTRHSPEGIEHSAAAFRRLIDMAIRHTGSYFLTYHKYARRAQVEACYPQFSEFLELKKKHDPAERFQSDWYRHYRKMFS